MSAAFRRQHEVVATCGEDEWIAKSVQLEGSLASSQHPLLYISLAGMAILIVVGGNTSVG